MLKMYADGEKDGKPVKIVVFGLSHKNLEKLREGKPIVVKGTDVGLEDVQIMIFAGKDEQTMQREFAQFIGPDTEVHIDPRLRE